MGDKNKKFDNVYFKANSKIKNIIGKDLIQDDITAVNELVKNSIDAGATDIDIKISDNSIIISDNGIGMSDDDLVNKWLNIAHSEKVNKEGLAGSKGIGRFSCDRLGKKTKLLSRKYSSESKLYNELVIDWLKFENTSAKDEISKIPVKMFRDVERVSNYSTIVEIYELRSDWGKDKEDRLRKSLQKLIIPTRESENNKTIREIKLNNIIIENKIYEYLDKFGTFVRANVTKDHIEVRLFFRNDEIFYYKKENNYSKLYNLEAQINYLTPQLKSQFTKQTGIQTNSYGSIFLFNNGFRVYPFGEVNNDYLGLSERKTQGYSRYLGNREVLGYISIRDNKYVLESSSREGLDKTGFIEELVSFVIKEMISNLEYYLVNVVDWDNITVGGVQRELTDHELNNIANDKFNKFLSYINKKASKGDVNKETLSRNVKEKQVDIKSKILNNREIKNTIEAKDKEIENLKSQNKLYSSTKEIPKDSSIFHDISNNISNVIDCMALIMESISQKNINIDEIKDYILEANKSANSAYDLSSYCINGIYKNVSDYKEYDFVESLKEIIDNDPYYQNSDTKVHIESDLKYIIKSSFLDMGSFLNNIHSNAKKAYAKNVYISFDKSRKELTVLDDGIGIKDDISIKQIKSVGFSTTYSTGMGIYYIDDFIHESLKSSMEIINDSGKFKIRVGLNDEYIA